jgi:uncharacterized protein (DUF427 family)
MEAPLMTDALEDRDLKAVARNRPNRDHPVWTEPYPRRVRAFLDGVAVVDSSQALLLLEAGHLPVYSFPPQDVRTDLLEATDKRDHGPDKGEASNWSVTVGDRVAPNAVWSYRDPLRGRDDITGCLALYWHRMEAWFEEDEEVFDPAMVPFAATYADQNERDSKALQGAVTSGRRTAQASC